MAVFVVRQKFRAPLGFSYRWCTDYSPKDPSLAKEGGQRRILRRTRQQVVYEDLSPSPEGWWWSRQTVKLQPPDRWSVLALGNYRTWRASYTLKPLRDGGTAFTFRGVRSPNLLTTKNPSRKEVQSNLETMWKHYARALEADYRRTRRPRR